MMKEFTFCKDCSLAQAVKAGAAFLQEKGIENAAYDSFALLSHLNGMSRMDYFLKGTEVLSEDLKESYRQYLIRRGNHEPLQHIMEKAYFYGYEFFVNENVLIPRQDTEVLIGEALAVMNDMDLSTRDNEEQSALRVMDMCTGSGCIILTLALEGHMAQGFGVDISVKALEVAKHNCSKLQATQVTFLESDIFKAIESSEAMEIYGDLDLLISNPPYIRSDVIPTLSEEVRLHDPMLALDGYEDGLYFYREITKKAPLYLKKGGWLLYEIGHDQGEVVSRLMKNSGFTEISVVRDLAGLDRVVRGRLL